MAHLFLCLSLSVHFIFIVHTVCTTYKSLRLVRNELIAFVLMYICTITMGVLGECNDAVFYRYLGENFYSQMNEIVLFCCTINLKLKNSFVA